MVILHMHASMKMSLKMYLCLNDPCESPERPTQKKLAVASASKHGGARGVNDGIY